jgi:hypothetical protein
MLFGHKNVKIGQYNSLYIQGNPIQHVESTKFLGMMVDERLTWKKHIDYIKLKISKALDVMSRVSQTLSN